MTDIEARVLKNQVEIMWTLHKLLEVSAHGLVGRGGEIDRMRDDLVHASKDTNALLNKPS